MTGKPARPLCLYGLTGGIASGKSEVARRFVAARLPVLDADDIGHELMMPGGAAEQEVISVFGERILTNGRVDREKLAAIVFGDAEARARLNAVMHPMIRREILRRCAALAQEGHKAAIVNAALIAEDGRRDPWLDGLVLVISSRETRLLRLTAQRGMTREEAQRRLDAQTPPERKLALADWVIENEGDLEALYARADEVAELIRKHAGSSDPMP